MFRWESQRINTTPWDNSGYKVNKTRKCFIKVGESGKASKRGNLSHDLDSEAVGYGRSWGAGSAEVLPMRASCCKEASVAGVA